MTRPDPTKSATPAQSAAGLVVIDADVALLHLAECREGLPLDPAAAALLEACSDAARELLFMARRLARILSCDESVLPAEPDGVFRHEHFEGRGRGGRGMAGGGAGRDWPFPDDGSGQPVDRAERPAATRRPETTELLRASRGRAVRLVRGGR